MPPVRREAVYALSLLERVRTRVPEVLDVCSIVHSHSADHVHGCAHCGGLHGPAAPDLASFPALLRWVRFLLSEAYKLASYVFDTGDELWHDELALCPRVSAYG